MTLPEGAFHGPIPTHGTGPEAIPADHPDAPYVPFEEQHHPDEDDEIELTVTVSVGTAADLLVWLDELDENGLPLPKDPVIARQRLAEAVLAAVDNMAENGRELDARTRRNHAITRLDRLANPEQYGPVPDVDDVTVYGATMRAGVDF